MGIDDDLIQRLLFAEREFSATLNGDVQMLTSFNQTWSGLSNVLQTASKTGSVGHETLSLAYSVASRIANLAACFLDIKRGEDYYTTLLQSDCDSMVQGMAALDLNANAKPSRPGTGHDACGTSLPSSPQISNSSGSFPPFLSSAYQWLLDNLHNPYPPAEVKTRIATTSSCHISSVNSWFANVRRRIGWTTLCRERFSSRRTDMIDAAYRAFVEEDPERALSHELRHAFIAIEAAAKDLYSSTFARTTFTGDFDTVLRNMKKDNKFVEAAQDSYPSPDRSITNSPIPPINGSVTTEDDVALPILAGSKRRRLSIDAVGQPSSLAERSFKRLRASTSSATHLPSPPSSSSGFDVSSDSDSPELIPARTTQSEENEVASSHKRHLPDTEDIVNIPKRPRGSIAALHTASDPLPHSDPGNEQSFDDWFNANFDALFNIPPPVNATEPDSSSSWEVELFKDYNIPGNSKPTTNSQSSASRDLSDLDNLLQSISGNTIIASGSIPPSDIAGVSCTASLDSSVPEFSQTSIDWSSLLNGSDMYQPTLYPTFSRYPTNFQAPLAEIDLPMLQLPHVAPPVSSQGELASKQAKLDQLHAMQEAVRRMEQELQSEGIL